MSFPSPLTCYYCGYSIADLPLHAVCPECSVPVDASVDARLRFDRSIPMPRVLAGLLAAIALIEIGLPIAGVASLLLNTPQSISWAPIMPLLVIAGGGIGIEAAWCVVASTTSVVKTKQAARLVGITSVVSALCLALGALSLLGGVLPLVLFAFAIFLISASIGATAKVIFMESIADLFPRRARERLTRSNRVAFVSFFVSIGCAFLGFLLPPMFVVILLAIAASAWRSYAFSRQIHSALPMLHP